jgi:hypothetical protein
VHPITDEEDWKEYETLFGPSLAQYVVQDMVMQPTNFPTSFKTVCFGGKALGAMLCYNSDPKEFTTNRGGGAPGISLSSHNLRDMSNVEEEILISYGIDGEFVPFGIEQISERIGRYCSAHGCQMIGIDFVVGRNRTPYCVDVTRDPGTGFFRVCFNGNKSTPIEKADEIRSRIYTAAAMQKFFSD